MFTWHTQRGYRYHDAYWQWIKVASPIIEPALDSDLLPIYHLVKSKGIEYDSGELSTEKFIVALRTAAELVEYLDLEDE